MSPINPSTYQRFEAWLTRYRTPFFGLAYGLFVLWGLWETRNSVAIPAMDWMRIFSFRDYRTSADILLYLKELRTGIPPFISLVEILSWNWWETLDWWVKGFYRLALIGIVLLPIWFTKRTIWHLLAGLPIAVFLLKGLVIVHPGNPQIYDVLLPVLLLIGLLLLKKSFTDQMRNWRLWLMALGAGFFLSMAELARPFMILLLPLLMGLGIYHFIQAKRARLILPFLIPILLFSGGWHLKLLIYNDGQVIWSNHGGTNLFRAWMPLVDQEAMEAQLQPEAPPMKDYNWFWDNLNTEIHAQNSKVRSQAVMDGIKSQPLAAMGLLWDKTLHFIEPQTAMYDYDPQGFFVSAYRGIVRLIYYLLALLLMRTVVRAIKQPISLLEWDTWLILITAFLSFMPIIGEAGEESRFLVSVLPFLMIVGFLGVEWIVQRLITTFSR
ncbi:MAG: hypothetical protein AAF399_19245 [Bacteroidota bacterium]